MKRTAAFLALLSAATLTAGHLIVTAPRPDGDRQKALVVLNRLGFGPRPGDVEKVLSMGIGAYMEEQLDPGRIPDRAVEARLRDYPTLNLNDAQLYERFYLPIKEARKERKLVVKEGVEAPGEAGASEKIRSMIPPENRPQRLIEELSAARILRAYESERQLNEVMVDFWMNHFNVYAKKGADRLLMTSYERDVIRPRVWGRFEDLLMATAKSPAMLFYLDNARSVAAPENRPQMAMRRGGFGRRGFGGRQMILNRPPQRPKQGGLNENYAREIMELHTLGVDGGYSQKDVTELARIFTGWSMRRPEEGGGFVFRARMHDSGSKSVMGVTFPAGGGQEEGERMIHILAHHPATARHIALQLCQRLVSDDPPPALVDRVAAKFIESDGDLRMTVRAIVTSPEFFDPRYQRAKVKSPFEFVISALRATNATVSDPLPLARQLNQMGEPLYLAQPPTGYSDAASEWINSGALLSRLNFALALSASKVPGTSTNVAALIPGAAAADPEMAVDALSNVLTGGELTAETRSTIRARFVKGANTPQPDSCERLTTMAGLILGSPEFQYQ